MRGYPAFFCLLALLAGCDDEPSSPPDAAPSPDAGPDAAPAPMPAPDLRFKMVGAADEFRAGSRFGVGAGVDLERTDELIFGPLQLHEPAPMIGGYNLFTYTPAWPIEPMHSILAGGNDAAQVDARLGQVLPGSVVSSLDVAQDSSFTFVVIAPGGGQPSYGTVTSSMPRDELDTFATDEGAVGHVITALSAHAGEVLVCSTRRPDEAGPYETRVVDATTATLFDVAAPLAEDGYVITGFGRVGADAYVLVGTRPAGEQAPRQLYISNTDDVSSGLALGYAPVGYVFVDDRHTLVLAEK